MTEGGPLSPIEVRGVENLPYMYRFQSGMIKLRLENPVLPGTPTRSDNQTIPPPITDSGVGLIMHVPVIWNPHDANAPLGYPGPCGPSVPASQSGLNFRLVADSVEPNFIAASGNSGYNLFAAEGEALSSPALNSLSPTISAAMVSASKYTTGPNGGGSMIPAGLGTGTSYSYPALTPSNAELLFQVPGTLLFREPTVLAMAGLPQGSNLQLGAPPALPSDYTSIQNSAGAFAYQGTGVTAGFRTDPNAVNPLDIPTAPSTTQPYIGICYGLFPIDWIGPTNPTSPATSGSSVYRAGSYTAALAGGAGPFITYRLQYKDPNTSQDVNGSGWVTYDEKYTSLITLFNQPSTGVQAGNLSDQDDVAEGGDWASYVDPRTSRFSAVSGRDFENPVQTPGGTDQPQEWSDQKNGVEVTDRPDSNAGYAVSTDRTLAAGTANTEAELGQLVAGGWNINLVVNAGYFRTGMFSQNTALAIDNGKRFTSDTVSNATETGPMYYADPDGVTRGGMGNYVTGTPPYSTVGLPLANAYGVNGAPIATQSPAYQAQSRPYILHRPFRSVAELGYVFSGTPWKNIDLFTPQSGDSSLLDVFTAYETPSGASNPNPLVAGVVNLNSQQTPVLQAILSGAYVDEVQTSTSGTTNTGFPPLTAQQAAALLNPSNGNTLPARTASSAAGQGPLQNVSELAGRWIGPPGAGAAGYSGPSGDLTTLYSAAFGNNTSTMQNVDRFREAFIRPLAAVGNTRVWNLMIDVIAQTGRYPQGANNPANFVVDGEQRYWVHVAIDRFTGQVLDKQVEVVKD